MLLSQKAVLEFSPLLGFLVVSISCQLSLGVLFEAGESSPLLVFLGVLIGFVIVYGHSSVLSCIPCHNESHGFVYFDSW